MKKTDLLIIDYKSSGLKRYAVDICKKLKKIDSRLTIIVGFAEMDCEIKSPYMDDFIPLNKYDFDARKVIDEYQPRAILVFAHRFLEYLFTIEAHKTNIVVFDFQHGFYMDSTVISTLTISNLTQIVRKKTNKLKVYLRCLFNMCNKSYFVLVKRLVDFIRYRSIYQVMSYAYGKECNADVSFIFGRYWITFYAKQYLIDNTEFVIIGYPELEGANMEVPQNYFEDNKLPVVCYLAQTSVEDGLIKKSDFDVFISDLLHSLDKINLLIKLHPRSDKSLYEEMFFSQYAKHVKIWQEKEFPVADAYIGHESTVIARALAHTNKVLVYRIKDNRISLFEQFTEYVSGAKGKFHEDFISMLTSTGTSQNPNLNDYVYWNKNEGAIQETANRIYNEIQYYEK